MARPAHWKDLAPPVSFSVPLQPLPRLPVLPLADTLDKLKHVLQPLAKDENEYEEATKKLDALGEEGGLGRSLQARLEERERRGVEGTDGGAAKHSWIEEWWDDGAYLGYRDSVVVNVSYYYGFTPSPTHLPSHPSHRAASLARAALLFRRQLYAGELKPDTVKEGQLCMDSYRWMFDCSRVPGLPLDWSVSYAGEYAAAGKPGHIVVVRNNRFWKIEVGDEQCEIIGTEELERQIRYVYDESDKLAPAAAVGVLGGNDRDTWAKDYALLSSSPANASLLRTIHSSAFLVCLDSLSPSSDPVTFSRACWHAGPEGETAGNKWFDKPCQFIVYDDGAAGFMGEHSVMDGTPTVRLCDEVLKGLHKPELDHGGPAKSSGTLPVQLEFELSADLHRAIDSATAAFHTLISSQALSYTLISYGKALPKKHGVSPDSWAQMIIQLAYARLGLGVAATYESATTRRFDHGRTEVVRTVCSESVAWVESMASETGSEERKDLFRKACARHIELARDAGQGRGTARHMFGLKHLLQPGEDVPAIYNDPVYGRAQHWNLSTSAIFSEHFPVYGWGEVVPDGFGVAYMTGYDDRFQFTITSRKEMPNERFCEEIQRAAEDIKTLFEGQVQSRL